MHTLRHIALCVAAPGEKVDPCSGVTITLDGDGKQPPDTPADMPNWQLGTRAVELDESVIPTADAL